MENKKSLLIIFTLIISAHLLLFANLDLEEKVVVAQNKPAGCRVLRRHRAWPGYILTGPATDRFSSKYARRVKCLDSLL